MLLVVDVLLVLVVDMVELVELEVELELVVDVVIAAILIVGNPKLLATSASMLETTLPFSVQSPTDVGFCVPSSPGWKAES
jgi:hypothetical protein